MKPQNDKENDSQTESETENDSQIETENDSQLESENNSQIESENDSQTESENDAQFESENDAQTEFVEQITSTISRLLTNFQVEKGGAHFVEPSATPIDNTNMKEDTFVDMKSENDSQTESENDAQIESENNTQTELVQRIKSTLTRLLTDYQVEKGICAHFVEPSATPIDNTNMKEDTFVDMKSENDSQTKSENDAQIETENDSQIESENDSQTESENDSQIESVMNMRGNESQTNSIKWRFGSRLLSNFPVEMNIRPHFVLPSAQRLNNTNMKEDTFVKVKSENDSCNSTVHFQSQKRRGTGYITTRSDDKTSKTRQICRTNRTSTKPIGKQVSEAKIEKHSKR